MAAFYLTFKGSIINFTSIWVKLTKLQLLLSKSLNFVSLNHLKSLVQSQLNDIGTSRVDYTLLPSLLERKNIEWSI